MARPHGAQWKGEKRTQRKLEPWRRKSRSSRGRSTKWKLLHKSKTEKLGELCNWKAEFERREKKREEAQTGDKQIKVLADREQTGTWTRVDRKIRKERQFWEATLFVSNFNSMSSVSSAVAGSCDSLAARCSKPLRIKPNQSTTSLKTHTQTCGSAHKHTHTHTDIHRPVHFMRKYTQTYCAPCCFYGKRQHNVNCTHMTHTHTERNAS